jgi:hypothetical protein
MKPLKMEVLRWFVFMGTPVFAQYSQTVYLKYLDAACVQKGLNKVIAYSQEVYGTGGKGGTGEYMDGTISQGAGNGLSFKDVTVELVSVEGDTTNPSARLYIFSRQRDREVTLSRGNSELFDNYRVRVNTIDIERKEVQLTIRLTGAATTPSLGLHPPGRVNVTADVKNATVSISADYAIDLQTLAQWVEYWDQPGTVDALSNKALQKTRGNTLSPPSAFTEKDLEALTKNYQDSESLKEKYRLKQISFTEYEAQKTVLERLKNNLLKKMYTSND